jgi:hypothetical protein
MSFDTVDFRQLKCPSRRVIDALNNYLECGESQCRASFAIPVIEVDDKGFPSSEAFIMLSVHATDTEISLIGERHIEAKRVMVQLPFSHRSATQVTIQSQSKYQSVWIYTGSISKADTSEVDASDGMPVVG